MEDAPDQGQIYADATRRIEALLEQKAEIEAEIQSVFRAVAYLGFEVGPLIHQIYETTPQAVPKTGSDTGLPKKWKRR